MVEGTWIDTAVVGAIIIVGLFIMYRALQEPMDHLFRLIGRGLGAIKDKVVGAGEAGGDYYNEITYG